MTIKMNMLMITAAAFITGSAAFAQDSTPPAEPTTPSVQFLLDLFSGDTAPTEADIAAAVEAAGYTVNRIEIDEDGEVRVRFTTADGVQYRFRLEDDELRFKQSDDVAGVDTSDANGEDTSDTSDSNDDDSSDDSSDDNGGSSSGSNSGSGGGSDD